MGIREKVRMRCKRDKQEKANERVEKEKTRERIRVVHLFSNDLTTEIKGFQFSPI